MKPRVPNLLSSVALLLFSAFSFSGCLDLSTSVKIDDEGGGVLSLEYSVDQRLYELGTFDGPSSEPAVPISRRDFELLVASISGAHLRSHSLKTETDEGDSSEIDRTVVSAEIDFDSIDVLNELLGTGGAAIRQTATGYDWTLFEGAGAVAMDEELVTAFFRENFLEFAFRGPSQVRTVSRGEVERGVARYELSLSEAVLSEDAVTWRIEL